MQLQSLSTAIEKINRKESNNEESEKSDTEERDEIKISDKVTIIARNKRNYDDDKVNNDSIQGRSEEEPEEKDQIEISKKDALASDILEHGEEYEKNKEKLFNKKTIITEEDDDDLIN